MRCKKHLDDLTSSVGVCSTCLRERLLYLIAVQEQAQAQLSRAAAAEYCRKPDPPPLIFPRSVSPYVSRRKCDDNSATWIHHQRFYSTPQVGPTDSSASTAYFESTRSLKKKNRFAIFSNLFRSRSEKFNLDPTAAHYYNSDHSSTASASPSWFATIFAVRRKKQQSSSKPSRVEEFDQFGPGNRRSCRVINRGMSPAIEVDSGDECDRPPPGGSPDTSPRWKKTPTPARRTRAAGTRNVSGLAFCLSPLVRASPNWNWNQKGGLPPDMFNGDGKPSTMKPHIATAAGFRANRSRKLADFGRISHNR